MSLCSWDPEGSRFAIVSEGNHVSIFDCTTGRLNQRIPLSFRLSIKYTCLLYFVPKTLTQASHDPDTTTTTPTAKRRLITSSHHYVCCGSSSGQIFVFSVSSGTLIKEVRIGGAGGSGSGSGGSVVAVQHLGSSDELLVLCSSSGGSSTSGGSLYRVSRVSDIGIQSSVSSVPLLGSGFVDLGISTLVSVSVCTHAQDGFGFVCAVSWAGFVAVCDVSILNSMPSYVSLSQGPGSGDQRRSLFFQPGAVGTHPTGSTMLQIVEISDETLGEAPVSETKNRSFCVVAGCVQERYVSVFVVCENQSTTECPKSVLAAQTHPVQVDIVRRTGTPHRGVDVLAVTQDGFVHIWSDVLHQRDVSESESETEQQGLGASLPTGTVRAVVENERRVHILAARFNPSKEGVLTIVTGTVFSPSFHEVVYDEHLARRDREPTEEPDGDVVMHDDVTTAGVTVTASTASIEIIVRVTHENQEFGEPSLRTDVVDDILAPPDPEKSSKKSKLLFGEVNMNDPRARFLSAFGSASSRPSEHEEEGESRDVQMTVRDDDDESTSDGSLLPTLQVTTTLFDALKYGDEATVNSVLSLDDSELISSTLRQLPSSLSLTLLDALVERYQKVSSGAISSFRSSLALPRWLKFLFLHHADALLKYRGEGGEGIMEKLSPLYHALTARLETFPMLLDLSGRLELLLALGGAASVDESDESDEEDEEVVEVVSSGVRAELEEDRDMLDDEEDLRRSGSNVFGMDVDLDDDEDDDDISFDFGPDDGVLDEPMDVDS